MKKDRILPYVFTAMAALLTASAAHALTMEVCMQSGEWRTFEVADGMVVRCAGDRVTIDATDTPCSFLIDDVRSLRYVDGNSDVEEVVADSVPFSIDNDGRLTLRSADAGNVAEVYDAAGKLLERIEFDTRVLLDLSRKGRGLYVVRVNRAVTLKIMVP